jgi:hypothetical protein
MLDRGVRINGRGCERYSSFRKKLLYTYIGRKDDSRTRTHCSTSNIRGAHAVEVDLTYATMTSSLRILSANGFKGGVLLLCVCRISIELLRALPLDLPVSAYLACSMQPLKVLMRQISGHDLVEATCKTHTSLFIL